MVDDLPLLALTQLASAGIAVVLAKAAALWHTYPEGFLPSTLLRLPSALALDMLVLAAATTPIALAAWFPMSLSRPSRLLIAAALPVLSTVWIGLSMANAAFLMTVGSPLDLELIRLAPRLGQYLLSTATKDTIGIAVAALALCLAPAGLTPLLLRAGRGRSRAISLFLAAGSLGCGLLLARDPPRKPEEGTLRNMTLVSLFLPTPGEVDPDTPGPTSRQKETLAKLLGPDRSDGMQAFSSLPRKRHNVLLVVWESVGERYLRSHPLGDAATPNLESLASLGSVRFRRAYAESPLSVQSVWTFFTGRTPPAKPTIFLDPKAMPPHGKTLPQILKGHGYRTSALIGSYARSWGADRIVGLGGTDLFEDIETLSKGGPYEQVGWSIDGLAINDRFWKWLDEEPKGPPFFSLLWNVETHYPYRWASMSSEDKTLGDYGRYARSIEHADRLLGALVKGLKERGLDEDTLIIVAGDHGEGMARAPHPNQRVHGTKVYEDSVQVPLVFIHPALRQAHIVESPVILADIFPSVLDLLGLDLPDDLDGVSLARALPPRPIVLHAMHWWPAAIRSGPYKLVVDNPRDRGALYQVEDDPTESLDLSDQQVEIALTLRAQLLFETGRRRRFDSSMDGAYLHPWIPERFRGPGQKRQPQSAPGADSEPDR